jgi:hypothetical protein
MSANYPPGCTDADIDSHFGEPMRLTDTISKDSDDYEYSEEEES